MSTTSSGKRNLSTGRMSRRSRRSTTAQHHQGEDALLPLGHHAGVRLGAGEQRHRLPGWHSHPPAGERQAHRGHQPRAASRLVHEAVRAGVERHRHARGRRVTNEHQHGRPCQFFWRTGRSLAPMAPRPSDSSVMTRSGRVSRAAAPLPSRCRLRSPPGPRAYSAAAAGSRTAARSGRRPRAS